MASPLARLDALLAAATPGPWAYSWVRIGKRSRGTVNGGYLSSEDGELVVWLVNHAAGLARIARAAEEVRERHDDVLAGVTPRDPRWCASPEMIDEYEARFSAWHAACRALREALAGLGAASEDGA